MNRYFEIGVLCTLLLAGVPAKAMPLGVRTLLHGHAVARQLAEAEPSPQVWTVTFDANGGVFDADASAFETTYTISVTNECAIGELPKATKKDYMFDGWFSSVLDGEQSSAEDVITSDVTLYAHWRCRFTFGNGDAWTQLQDGSWKSGMTVDGTTNSLSMIVKGEGTISFRWKTSCEDYFNFKGTLLRQDGLVFFIDGEEKSFANGIMSEWAECSFEINGSGSHTLSWAYVKDASGSDGEDCAWIDTVKWSSNDIVVDVGAGKSLAVPRAWIADYPELVLAANGDVENAVRNGIAANGRKVWECYVLGLDPEKADEDFKIVSFPMKADGTPDVDNIVFDPSREKWNVQGARAVLKGASELGGEWRAVTEENKASFRFFKVVVELP